MEYEIIRSGRKTLSVEVRSDGTIVVRAPYRLSEKRIEQFLFDREEWILNAQRKMLARAEQNVCVDVLSEKELTALKKEAEREFAGICEAYASIMGVSYNRITIKALKTRWGSCSREKNLNFNCLLMLAPEEVRRYVAVHELCHLREMNHSQKFWVLVTEYCPDWKNHRRWLKLHGDELIRRLPK